MELRGDTRMRHHEAGERRSEVPGAGRSLALVAALAGLGPAARAAPRVTPRPIPPWVRPLAIDLTPRATPQSRHGIEGLLDEVQTFLGEPRRARFIHYADRV